jgi:hypothetical protein
MPGESNFAPPQTPNSGTPNYYGGVQVDPAWAQAVAGYYQKYLGRAGGANEVNTWAYHSGLTLPQIEEAIKHSQEATMYNERQAAQPPAAPPPAATTSGDWIHDTLQSVQSTDDENYWRQVIGNDPKVAAGDQSAIDYWKQRIRQGDGSMLVKTGQLQKFQDTGGMPALPSVAPFAYGPWTDTFQAPEWTGGQFTAPTAATEQNDPGYDFRLQQGLDQIRADAASKGVLMSGGTDKALTRYAQDYASNEYKNVYDRALQQYGLAYQQFLDTYGQKSQQYQQKYGQYMDAYNQALQQYGTNYGVTADQWNRAMSQYLQRYGEGQTAYQNQQNEQANYWNRMMQLYDYGFRGATGANDTSQRYATNASDYMTQLGNAYAGGQAGAASAWSGLYGNAANQLFAAPYMYGNTRTARSPFAYGGSGQYWGSGPNYPSYMFP